MVQISKLTHSNETGMSVDVVAIPKASVIGVTKGVGDELDGGRCISHEDQVKFIRVGIKET
jgi:hypothetical protein